jgi:hypothetical protein
MNKEIDAQVKACGKLSDELDFISSHYPVEAPELVEQNKLLKTRLQDFIEACTDSDDDLVFITRIRVEADMILDQIRAALAAPHWKIIDSAKQQKIINSFNNFQQQIAALNAFDRTKFKRTLVAANAILKKIVSCRNNAESLQYRLSGIGKQDLKPTARFSMTYFFHSNPVSRKKELESQQNKNNLQLATHTHKLMRQLLNIFHIQQDNNLNLQANSSVVKFRTNSHVLAFAEDAKRRPAFTSSALGFVKE